MVERGAGTADARAEHVVIGSGPGGALTACLLAEAGRDVVLVEEGPRVEPGGVASFSVEEMRRKYRGGGPLVALGRSPIAYVEGRCVGGGSEINSGLYHRPPAAVLEEWRREFQVEALSERDLEPHCEANERELGVGGRPPTVAAPAASLKLRDGAEQLGWRCEDVPRFFDHAAPGSGRLRSMLTSFIPRFLAAGGRLVADAQVRSLARVGSDWAIGWVGSGGRTVLRARSVWVAAGAIQTPLLLRRSGVRRNIGNSLRLHPMIRVTARFADDVNPAGAGIATHQVHEFVPRFNLGCSVSTPPYLALALLSHQRDLSVVQRDRARLAIYWAATRGGLGSVRAVPLFRDPLVRYRLSRADRVELADALRALCRVLLAAGAERLWPMIDGQAPIDGEADLQRLPSAIPIGRSNLVSFHLFSSCPMGEDRSRTAVDSFGRVHGQPGLHIADASILCTAPGVNPQGTVMAIARRNVRAVLG